MFFTYVLQSEKDGSYYIGSTKNLESRLKRHNKGYSRFTKSKRPFKIIYKEEFTTKSEAIKREYYLKSLKSRIAIQELIQAAVV